VSLLWSINEQMAGREGLEIERPTLAWLDDLLWLDEREADRERRRNNVLAKDDDDG